MVNWGFITSKMLLGTTERRDVNAVRVLLHHCNGCSKRIISDFSNNIRLAIKNVVQCALPCRNARCSALLDFAEACVMMYCRIHVNLCKQRLKGEALENRNQCG